MTNSIVEVLVGYVFAIALFVGLPTIVLSIVFLPGLMHTTGETIGSSDRKKDAVDVAKMAAVPSRPKQNRTLTMANTA